MNYKHSSSTMQSRFQIWSRTQVRPSKQQQSDSRLQGASRGVSVQRTDSCCCRDSDARGRSTWEEGKNISNTGKQTASGVANMEQMEQLLSRAA